MHWRGSGARGSTGSSSGSSCRATSSARRCPSTGTPTWTARRSGTSRTRCGRRGFVRTSGTSGSRSGFPSRGTGWTSRPRTASTSSASRRRSPSSTRARRSRRDRSRRERHRKRTRRSGPGENRPARSVVSPVVIPRATNGGFRMRKIFLGLAMLAIVGTACSVDLAGNSSGGATDLLNSTPAGKGGAIETVVHDALPAVVNVTTDVFQPDQFGNVQQGKGVGTGFIIRQDGIVVTNCHVVEGGSKITVSTSADKPQRYDARVIGGDCQHDLAVLKVDATGLPTVPLGDSGTLELGQSVVAIGYALALEGGPTVTSGLVSSLESNNTVAHSRC